MSSRHGTRSRRTFLREAATLAGGVIVAACGGPQPAAPRPTEPVKQTGALPTTVVQSAPTALPKATAAPAATSISATAAPAAKATPKLAGDIQVWVGTNYQPSDTMEKSPQNLQPHDAVIRIGTEYKKLHPEVGKIEWITVPTATDARLWTETSQAGGTIPHISWQHSFQIDNDTRKDWWLPLDDFVSQPNPYVTEGPGSKAWIDQFFEIPTSTKKSIDGHLYVIPYDLITTFFYYNKNLFAKAGIDDAPKTWAEYEKAQQALKDKGITPNGAIGWVDTQIAQMVFSSLEEKVHPGGGPVLRREVACAISNKTWDFETPMGADYLRILKSMVAFHDPDWSSTAVTFDGWRQKFKTGQIAIYEYHTQLFGLLKADPELKFDWGAFYCPTITKETSQFSTGRAAPPIGGATSTQLAVTSRAKKDDRVALAVDLLQYLSVPTNAELMIGELGNRLPNVKGVNVAEDLKGPLAAITHGYGEAAMFVYGDKVSQEVNKKRGDAIKLMRLGKATVEETQHEIQQLQLEGAQDDIKQNNWSCA